MYLHCLVRIVVARLFAYYDRSTMRFVKLIAAKTYADFSWTLHDTEREKVRIASIVRSPERKSTPWTSMALHAIGVDFPCVVASTIDMDTHHRKIVKQDRSSRFSPYASEIFWSLSTTTLSLSLSVSVWSLSVCKLSCNLKKLRK